MLRDLDLSGNALEGPVGPTTVPTLRCLSTLQLSDNTFASIRRGALSGEKIYLKQRFITSSRVIQNIFLNRFSEMTITTFCGIASNVSKLIFEIFH